MLRFKWCLPALVSLLLAGCQKENQFDCFKSTGKTTTVTRPLALFNSIRLEDDALVILVQDSNSFVEIKGGANLTDNILTEINNQELIIRNINKCNWVRSYKPEITVTVHTPTLLNIFHDGTKTIRTEGRFKAPLLFLHQTGAGDYNLNLDCGYIWLDMYELGDMHLEGETDTLFAYLYGLGNLKARNLETGHANLIMNGSGESTLFTTKHLFAILAGNGNLYYYGNPLQKQITELNKGKAIQSF